LYDIHVNRSSPAVFSDVLLANKIMTLQEVFGPAAAGWTTTGIDGVIPSANDRVLLAGQTNAVQNGLWQVSTDGTSLQRPSDFAAGSHAESAYVFVNGSGASNDNKGFLCTNNSETIVDTDAQAWQVYTAAGGLGGLSVNGSTISTSSSSVSFANPVTLGSLSLTPAHIVDSSGTVTFTDTNIVAPSVQAGSLSTSAGSLTDSSGLIVMGSTNLSTSGQAQATAFTSPSDCRLKDEFANATVIRGFPSKYTDLYNLQPKTFSWKSDKRRDVCLIAQEVQATLAPYSELKGFVSPISDNGNVSLGVDFSKLSTVNMMLIKDLHQRLDLPDVNTPVDYRLTMWQAFKKLYQHVDDLQGVLAAVARQIPYNAAAPPRGFSIVTDSDDLPPGTTGINGLTPWE
jgi:hypothetical protein